jgi:hypothetical protein
VRISTGYYGERQGDDSHDFYEIAFREIETGELDKAT